MQASVGFVLPADAKGLALITHREHLLDFIRLFLVGGVNDADRLYLVDGIQLRADNA